MRHVLQRQTILVLAIAAAAFAQKPEPAFDPRLAVHTLVREDLFAGFLANDMERFARAEKNLELLLAERPKARAEILSLQAAAAVYRAVLAHEANRPQEFEQHYTRALSLFADAATASPGDPAVAAVAGGAYVFFADRLPEQHRAAAWSRAYDAFQGLWKMQSGVVEKLPVHLKGELLAGVAQSAHRTGRTGESAEYLEKILTLLPGTGYAAAAKKWKEDPAAVSNTALACHSCHESGRLAARRAALSAR